jgi:hypothetical protein
MNNFMALLRFFVPSQANFPAHKEIDSIGLVVSFSIHNECHVTGEDRELFISSKK